MWNDCQIGICPGKDTFNDREPRISVKKFRNDTLDDCINHLELLPTILSLGKSFYMSFRNRNVFLSTRLSIQL